MAEQRLVLGTAGHIDHGKTALIRALTGVETDRLPEEKARGITIDLGFAPLDLGDDTRVSVIDVPGHEGLVRTMVSGATGIDLVLLVVAADEGVMPQTREHVAICNLLGIHRGVVALTKIDVAEEDVAELAEEEVAELLAGSGLAGAPIVRVSSITGDGIDRLRATLAEQIADTPPRTSRTGPPRLSVDRTFAARGFGSVVTGTLVGAPFEVGDTVEIYPSGARARVRGLQSHGEDTKSASPGIRCAINLQGIEVAELSRGQVISRPDAIVPTLTADVKLWWLQAAPACEGTISIEFLAGTAERRARLAPIAPEGEDQLLPGETHFARLHIEGDPVALVPGDRFIARGFARTDMGGSTVGGGVVLDIAPPHRRRSDPELLRDLEELAHFDILSALRVRIRRAGLTGADQQSVLRELGQDAAEVDAALAQLAADAEAHLPTGAAVTRSGRWLAGAAVDDLEQRLVAALERYHAAQPMRPGMPTAALRGSLPDNVPRDAAELALDRLARDGRIALEGDVTRLEGFAPKVDAGDEATLAKLEAELVGAGLEAPSPKDLGERLDIAPERLQDLLAHLERNQCAVRAPGNLWFDRAAVDRLRERVIDHIREHGELTTPDYKALIGTTRRTAVPLMELFDTEHLTVRKGEVRVLRAGG